MYILVDGSVRAEGDQVGSIPRESNRVETL